MPVPEKLMIKAAKSGDTSTLKTLLATDRKLIGARDSDGSTPLHCAAWKGHVFVVQLLLAAGADVNAINQNEHWGTTPLHAAAHANQAKIAELLLANGANRKPSTAREGTPCFTLAFTKQERWHDY
jgi:ankyrin repeat protein